MDDVIRLLMRFLLVPLGYLAGSIVATLVVLAVAWRLFDMAIGGHPDGPALAAFGLVVGGPVLLVFVFCIMLLPASIGILISEAFAIRSWVFHALNGIATAWLGGQFYTALADGRQLIDQPMVLVAAGIAGGLAYWLVAGRTAGFYKPVFRHPESPETRR